MQPNKKILYGVQAQAELKKGIDAVVDAVKITLGPSGRNVALDRPYRSPRITNDGVSIAQTIKLKDSFNNMGVKLAQQVAATTDSIAGDGTTTTLILLQAIIQQGQCVLAENPKVNVMDIKRGIDIAVNEYVKTLKEKAVPVTTLEEIKNVAHISVENEEIAQLIAETLFSITKKGVITVEESEKPAVTVDSTEGMRINKGYASSYIINNWEKGQGEYRDVPALVTSNKILLSDDIVPLLKILAGHGNNKLLLIADDIDGEALASFNLNHSQRLFDIIPVRFSVFGEGKYEELEDIAISLGTTVFGERTGKLIKNAVVTDLGHCKSLIIKKDMTQLIGSMGTEVDQRVVELEKLKENTEELETKNIIDRRIGNLLSKVAVIKVGAETETARKYLKDKIDDAVNATRGAMEQGVVAGGGWALADILYTDHTVENKDIELGIHIINQAVVYPYLQLLRNCGIEMDHGAIMKGYNAKTNKYVNDLIVEGVVDPVKVTINALQNAASAAAMFLTTEVIIADEEEMKPEVQQ